MNLVQPAIVLLLACNVPGSSAKPIYLPLSKAKMDLPHAKATCKQHDGRLSLGTADALNHLQSSHKSAWVDGIYVSRHEIPQGVTVYYQKGAKCCKTTHSSKECNSLFCNTAVAAPLCVDKKTARKQRDNH